MDTLYALQYKKKCRLSNAHPEKPNSHVNFRYLSDNQKVQRMHNMKAAVQATRSQLAYLEKQLVETTKVKGVLKKQTQNKEHLLCVSKRN